MSDYFCAFCGLDHGPDPRSCHSPCPKVRALKFDGDGTLLYFKLKGVKGWQHKSQLKRAISSWTIPVNTTTVGAIKTTA